jgi:hypothetical protein
MEINGGVGDFVGDVFGIFCEKENHMTIWYVCE